MYLLTALLLLIAVAFLPSPCKAVLQLTENNYETLTDGKTVFIKCFAPWCGHCKAMAPDWEKLANDWNGHPIGLVAEIDCTDPESESLCETLNVEGFPTLLYGDPLAPTEYFGGRDYDSLNTFAKVELNKAICSASNMDSCSPEERKIIKSLMDTKTKDELIELVLSVNEEIESVQGELDVYIDQINEEYEIKSQVFVDRMEELKTRTDYKWMKQVLAKVHGITFQSEEDEDDSDIDEDEDFGDDDED